MKRNKVPIIPGLDLLFGLEYPKEGQCQDVIFDIGYRKRHKTELMPFTGVVNDKFHVVPIPIIIG